MEVPENIIDKIKKLLALAEDKRNCSEAEVESAALKAQELIAKYNVSIASFNSDEEEKEEITYSQLLVESHRKWRFALSTVVSENFRCECFWTGNSYVSFFGHKTDAAAAKEVYKFLFNMGNKLGKREVRRMSDERGITEDVYNTFVAGFIIGLRQKFNEQCIALAIIESEEVKEEYKKFSKDFKKGSDKSFNYRKGLNNTLQNGINAGRSAMSKREISA